MWTPIPIIPASLTSRGIWESRGKTKLVLASHLAILRALIWESHFQPKTYCCELNLNLKVLCWAQRMWDLLPFALKNSREICKNAIKEGFVIVDGCGSWPYVPSLRSVCFLQTKHILASSFLDLAGGSLLAIYCACNVTDCKYAFNQPNEESRSKELDTNTRSRKLELMTIKLIMMEKSGSRTVTTVFQLHSKNQFACQICIP